MEAGVVTVRGLFETHVTVRDMERSVAFYRDVVGLTLAHRVPERHVTFFWVGGPGKGLLGLWALHTSPIGLKLHLAFDVALEQLLQAPRRLRAAGLVPRDISGDPTDEPVVLGWMPAASVYFDDPDGHQLEFISMLPAPPRPEAGVVPYSQWVGMRPA